VREGLQPIHRASTLSALLLSKNGMEGSLFKCAGRYLVRASERYRIPGKAVLKAIDFGVDVKTFAILTDTAAHSR
jgi:hypothetical protein